MDRNRLKCSMCYHFSFCRRRLINHYVRTHQNDPRFSVTCCVAGCAATYNKWESFRKHVYRHHADAGLEVAFHPDLNNDPDDYVEPGHELERHLPMEEVNHVEMDSLHVLQWHAAKFLLHVRDKCKTSHKAMEVITEGAQRLMKEYISLIKKEKEIEEIRGPHGDLVPVANIFNILDEQMPSSVIFSEVNSKYKLDKFLAESLNMIIPQTIELKRERVWKRKPIVDLVEVTRYGYYISVLSSLRRLLSNFQVRHCVDNPRPSEHVMKSVLDGSYYKTHNFFSNNLNSLAIILYYDELEIVNPLGPYKHKLGMFYWTLANIYPEYRSSLNAINLLAVAKYSYLQGSGLSKLLTKFVEEITTLQTDGISITVDNVEKIYKGSLLLVTGDNPASAFLGGFKKSVSATRPCRRCMTDQDRWRQYCLESDFVLRTLERHEEHCAVVSDPTLRRGVRNFWKRYYGVNERSVLMDIPGFDVTKSLVQDTMHLLSEGILKVALLEFLRYCLNHGNVRQEERGFFSLETLNSRIDLFDYGHLQGDKPCPILPDHLDKALKGTAAQMLCLAHVLPFLIGDLLIGDDGVADGEAHEKLLNHIKLLQITNVCFAYEISEGDAQFLEGQIQTWLSEFKECYPGAIVPKFHFLLHVIRQILEFGPLRQQNCMRFEASHQWYKSLIRVTRNFKNVPLTFAYRQEALKCQQLSSFPGSPSVRFLYMGHSCQRGPTMLLRDLPPAISEQLLQKIINVNLDNCQVMMTKHVTVHGVTYKKNSLLLVKCDEDDFPVFGRITDIVAHNDDIYFAYVPFVTVLYEETLNAYKVNMTQIGNQSVIHVSERLYCHSLSAFKFNNFKYIVLFNHTRTEFVN